MLLIVKEKESEKVVYEMDTSGMSSKVISGIQRGLKKKYPIKDYIHTTDEKPKERVYK